MFELLTYARKKSLKKEYLMRILIISLLFLLAAGILFLFSFLPSYFLSAVKSEVVNKEFENIKNSNKAADNEELQTEIKNSKELLVLIEPAPGEFSIKDLIIKIVSRKSPGIKIDGVSMSHSQGRQYQVTVRGRSKKRELLKVFVENLREEKDFNNVELPISNFAKISDIDFNITLKINI